MPTTPPKVQVGAKRVLVAGHSHIHLSPWQSYSVDLGRGSSLRERSGSRSADSAVCFRANLQTCLTESYFWVL